MVTKDSQFFEMPIDEVEDLKLYFSSIGVSLRYNHTDVTSELILKYVADGDNIGPIKKCAKKCIEEYKQVDFIYCSLYLGKYMAMFAVRNKR